MFVLNVVLCGIRVSKGFVDLSYVQRIHGGRREGVALAPQLVVFLLQSSADPGLRRLGNLDFRQWGAALVLQLG